jgi:hypothetical protein
MKSCLVEVTHIIRKHTMMVIAKASIVKPKKKLISRARLEVNSLGAWKMAILADRIPDKGTLSYQLKTTNVDVI